MRVFICPRLPGQLTAAELSLRLATILCRNKHLLLHYVTIACEDKQMQAHKKLSVFSPFFRYKNLQSVLNFMYHEDVGFPDYDAQKSSLPTFLHWYTLVSFCLLPYIKTSLHDGLDISCNHGPEILLTYSSLMKKVHHILNDHNGVAEFITRHSPVSYTHLTLPTMIRV